MKLKPLLLSLGAILACAAPAFAIPQVTMGLYNAGSGGNYRANPNAELEWVLSNYVAGKSTDGTWFGTFCLEKNEYFSANSTYNAALNNKTLSSGTGNGDVISEGTAYLYTLFATGMLPVSYYGSGSKADDLQDLIWYLEGEQNGWGNGTYNSLLNNKFGNDWKTLAKVDYTGSAVQVLNLTQTNDRGRISHYQDQLVYVGVRVPDAGTTALLMGLGLFGIAFARRRLA